MKDMINDNKLMTAVILIAIVVFGFVLITKEPVQRIIMGQSQENEGREHIPSGQYTEYKNEIPTSGPHADPVGWGAYDQQVPNENIVHNMEHGGIIVSYATDADPELIAKLRGLFSAPFADESFTPSKSLVMPRGEQEPLILLTSWDRIFTLDEYDEQQLKDYYLNNVNKSPEPNAS
jgi:hypothetical protein